MMKKALIGGVGIMLLSVVSVVLLLPAGQGQADATKPQVRAVAVEVTPVLTGTITETVSAVGTVEAMQDVEVSSETAGRVTRVLVKPGDLVKAGQVLVTVDDELKVIAVEQAKAQVIAAETNLHKTEKDYQRAEALYASHDIADVEMETYRLAFRSSEAQYKSAVVGLKYAERQLQDTRIKAPLSGTVARRYVEVGEMVAPGMQIANIVDIKSVKVKLTVAEEEIGRVNLDQRAVLHLDSRPGTTFLGTVYSVGAKTESPTGHAYPVEIIVRNTSGQDLKVGMFARVDIETGTAPEALTISKESLVESGSAPAVYVVENGLARLRTVKLGFRQNDRVQVTSGLRQGDLVISFGQKGLQDGSPVQYHEEGK